MNIPSILIIIVTWNKKSYVLNLLDSLNTLHYPRTAVDIVVIDNASNDGTAEAIKKTYPDIHVICNSENLGGTGGFNTGLQWAYQQADNRYKYLWLLDNDVLVHRYALNELVSILENKADVAVAGSTMMQLDYPWRINEMGAFLDRGSGQLVLNHHLKEIQLWQGVDIQALLQVEVDLSMHLRSCQPMMDVEYVAAASLLIRADVAKKAGLWRDYFIHFDDVEWCLRIANMGYRVVVSAKSLIWHLSAAAKVPTWVLYYDNRNLLDLLKTHGADIKTLQRLKRRILLKSLYYQLIGKPDLADLHHHALADFESNTFGKKNIILTHTYQNFDTLDKILIDSSIKRILVSWTVNINAMPIQEIFVQALMKRPELTIDFLTLIGEKLVFPLPKARFIFMPKNITRWLVYWKLRGKYDLVIQSDYRVSLGLSWLKSDILFINQEGFCLRPPADFRKTLKAAWIYMKSIFR
jgi:GT2 family glycosyltransferase